MAGAGDWEVPEGSQQQPITIDDDVDLPQSAVGAEVREIVDRVQHCGARPVKAEEDDEDLPSEDPWAEDEANYDKANEAIEAIDLTAEESEPEREKVSVGTGGHCKHWKKGIRNPCCCGTHYNVPEASTPDVDFKVMQLVELKEAIIVGRYQAEFMEVRQIFYPYEKGNAFIRGFPFARTRNLDGRIDPRKNEVCALLEIDTNDDRPSDIQALVETPLDNIKAVRILHKTNKIFPECRFDPVSYLTKEDREARAPLTCRWVMIQTYPDARYRRAQRAVGGEELRHYNESDVVKDRHRISDDERLTTWRKGYEKVPGGSYIPKSSQKTKIEPNPETTAETKRLPGQKYSAVDIFSGAGGFSKGAEMAGFKILTACDHWSHCCETYRENFPDTDLHEENVHDFIRDTNTDLTTERQPVDFVHLSPPCQFYSPAHTCPGKNDEANIATLFACEYIILIYRPRLFTVEQTFGLSQDRHSSYFNAFIQGFTRHGYSVKWKVIHLVEFGLPQTRKRLFMMGAAPGEALPDWPAPTHGKEPTATQKPLVSAAQACSRLVEGVNLHDVAGARPVARIPWDGDKPLERTITTSGGQCYHWSGERELTLAEFAALQGFPRNFVFCSKCIKKQIGNAFPPVVVKAFMKRIREHLEEVDGVRRLPEPGLVIDLGDGDDDDDDDDDKDDEDIENDDNDVANDDDYQSLFQWVINFDVEPFLQGSTGKYDEKEANTTAKRGSQHRSQVQHHDLIEDEAIAAANRDSQEEEPQSRPDEASQDHPVTPPNETRHLSFSDMPNAAIKPQATWGAAIHTSKAFKQATVEAASAAADRRKSSADSVTYVGESSRAGSSRQLPLVVEDTEAEDTEAEAESADAEGTSHSPSPSLSDRQSTGPVPSALQNSVILPRARPSASHNDPTLDEAPSLGREDALDFPGGAGPGCRRLAFGEPGEGSSSSSSSSGSSSGSSGRGGCIDNGNGHRSFHGADHQAGALRVHDSEERVEQVDLTFEMSLEDREQEGNNHKGEVKGKEAVRNFKQYDDGQDNAAPKGSKGKVKRMRNVE
ncbi:Modification methylase HphIA [Cytospora mali]|uniref:DNA (cytosine-5-)-methyltransferase n=1 Tax=Cytospora mali TaxID=578113 RepID=A0A194WAQ6_CYTMA|nr:Modification methylase HphIA [Valsa mali]